MNLSLFKVRHFTRQKLKSVLKGDTFSSEPIFFFTFYVFIVYIDDQTRFWIFHILTVIFAGGI